MTAQLEDVCGASLPAESLAVLAELRCQSGVTVALDGGRAWVRWPVGTNQVLDRLLAAPGVEFYVHRGEAWSRLGSRLPAGPLPFDQRGQPLVNVLTPAPVRPVAANPQPLRPVRLRLVPSDIVHPATALRCRNSDLLAWADRVPAQRLALLAAAGWGDQVLLVRRKLPPLAAGERFWGTALFVPLGWRPEPEFPNYAWRELLGLGEKQP